MAAGKGMAEAAEGMRAVLGALRRRLEDGCTALQEAEQLHGRKAALAHRSMQLLHAHCLSTLRCVSPAARQPLPQPLPAAAAAAASDRGTQPSAGGSANSARMSEPPVPLCTALSAALEGASCVVRARLWDDSCSFDLESAQLLVSLADGPITAFPQPTQQAAEQTGSGRPSELERQQRGGGSGVSMSTRLDIQGLVASSSRAPLDVIAIVPLLSHRLNSASDPRAATEGLHQQCSYHMQHLGSLRLDWPEMLRCRSSQHPDKPPRHRGDQLRGEMASVRWLATSLQRKDVVPLKLQAAQRCQHIMAVRQKQSRPNLIRRVERCMSSQKLPAGQKQLMSTYHCAWKLKRAALGMSPKPWRALLGCGLTGSQVSRVKNPSAD